MVKSLFEVNSTQNRLWGCQWPIRVSPVGTQEVPSVQIRPLFPIVDPKQDLPYEIPLIRALKFESFATIGP